MLGQFCPLPSVLVSDLVWKNWPPIECDLPGIHCSCGNPIQSMIWSAIGARTVAIPLTLYPYCVRASLQFIHFMFFSFCCTARTDACICSRALLAFPFFFSQFSRMLINVSVCVCVFSLAGLSVIFVWDQHVCLQTLFLFQPLLGSDVLATHTQTSRTWNFVNQTQVDFEILATAEDFHPNQMRGKIEVKSQQPPQIEKRFVLHSITFFGPACEYNRFSLIFFAVVVRYLSLLVSLLLLYKYIDLFSQVSVTWCFAAFSSASSSSSFS